MLDRLGAGVEQCSHGGFGRRAQRRVLSAACSLVGPRRLPVRVLIT
jgi:hypothetical protein